MAAPARWSDLADDRLRGELALADPTKSSSINKAFEMVIQQAMQERLTELETEGFMGAEAVEIAVRDGWLNGFQLLQNLGANARYFLGLWGTAWLGSGFPAATMLVNVTGSFGLGLYLTLVAERYTGHQAIRLLVATGFFGANLPIPPER